MSGAGTLRVAGALCAHCLEPITLVLGGYGSGHWLTPPILNPRLAAVCRENGRHGGPHVPETSDGLVIAGWVTPESVKEHALETSGIGLALVEHVAQHAYVTAQRRRSGRRAA